MTHQLNLVNNVNFSISAHHKSSKLVARLEGSTGHDLNSIIYQLHDLAQTKTPFWLSPPCAHALDATLAPFRYQVNDAPTDLIPDVQLLHGALQYGLTVVTTDHPDTDVFVTHLEFIRTMPPVNSYVALRQTFGAMTSFGVMHADFVAVAAETTKTDPINNATKTAKNNVILKPLFAFIFLLLNLIYFYWSTPLIPQSWSPYI